MFYDAEHFFDGYKANPDYALQTIRRAVQEGAERTLLCDTNGGTMPWEIRDICAAVKRECGVPLGIHAHNDTEMAVANSLVAIECGIVRCKGPLTELANGAGMPISVRFSQPPIENESGSVDRTSSGSAPGSLRLCDRDCEPDAE